MRPGTSIFKLHGLMPLKKRVGVFQDYCRRESGALFATDIAARGLDFPAVDWVVQMDCPSDVQEYIHRCGRTARYKSGGHALLVLTSAQKESMLKKLEEIRIPISEIRADPSRLTSVHKKLEFLCAKFPELKTFAQRVSCSNMS
ncbi:unnamed protein product [Soboliphyme baturini]|uniref:ATP-dependent RNA helicase n=1 Tax=Soboliphyme baturini TaxID=241478 RepID=A0A183J739_9BILA|nr:unnamed protein product [Soboliphyme baturini]